ncbi:MAG: hypothetical protein J0I87_04790, partial [Cellulomonas sp.]|nr:hypothetical protein [Cellulomonas sp.]
MSETTTAPVAAVGDVITFTYTDPMNGQQSTRRGVVEQVGEAGHLIVQPVGDYFLQVAPAEVQIPTAPAQLVDPTPAPAPVTDPTNTTVPASAPAP